MAVAGYAAKDRMSSAVPANALTSIRKDAVVLTPAQFITLQLSGVVAAILEAIYATNTQNVVMVDAATLISAKIATAQPVLVKTSVSRKIVKNATAKETAKTAQDMAHVMSVLAVIACV